MKRKNPYQYLLDQIREFCDKLKYRHKIFMWRYPKWQLKDKQFNLMDLWERTSAAEQLGYDVILDATDDGIEVSYIKKVPDIPFNFL